MTPTEYLKRPYGRFVVPESDGTFRAEIIEFPGCIAVGDTSAEALSNLESVAESWLEVTLAKGQRIPDPVENVKFSGKLVVRLPRSVHRKASHIAAREGVSLNHFIVSSISEQIGMRSAAPHFSHVGITLQLSAGWIPSPSGNQQHLLPSTGTQLVMSGPERANARS